MDTSETSLFPCHHYHYLCIQWDYFCWQHCLEPHCFQLHFPRYFPHRSLWWNSRCRYYGAAYWLNYMMVAAVVESWKKKINRNFFQPILVDMTAVQCITVILVSLQSFRNIGKLGLANCWHPFHRKSCIRHWFLLFSMRKVVTSALANLGAPETLPGPKCLHFGKNLSYSRYVLPLGGWRPLWKILDPPLLDTYLIRIRYYCYIVHGWRLPGHRDG